MQVIRDTTLGGSIGSQLGTGLSDLAGLKLAQLTKQYDRQQERTQFAQGLTPLLGKDTANFLSNLDPQERNHALQNISSLMQLNQQPGQQENGIQVLQAEQGQQQPQMTQDRAKLFQDIFTSPQEKREQRKLQIVERQSDLKERESAIKETKQYVDTLRDKEKAIKESNIRLKRMENLIDKGNLPNANLWSFLTKIEDAGPLASGAAGALLGHVVPGIGNVIGGVAGALSSPLAGAAKSFIKSGAPDIEEFEKLSNEFVKNAKQYFGSRITEKEVQMFMQTVPTLMQTDAGKKKIIENIRSLNELSEIEAKAARTIIKNNGGVPPRNIEQLVQDKIAKKLDRVAKKFIEA